MAWSLEISQIGLGMPMGPPTQTQKWAKYKNFFSNFFRTKTGRVTYLPKTNIFHENEH
jgi:hypothetical protein